MKIGKLPNEVLENIILNKLNFKRTEILTRPEIGEDCSVVDFGENVLVMSCDPITGTSYEIGRLAVHITCNDIASCGVEPLGLMVTILAPPDITENDLERIAEQLSQTAASINVDILGGHTEITDTVSQMVIVSTAIGRGRKNSILKTGGARPGDDLVITKHAGMEGTAIIAMEKEKELTGMFGKSLVEEAKDFMNKISVVGEGITAAEYGASAMHDVTEGGVLGAVWEMCRASQKGAVVYRDKIPVSLSTFKICEYYNIDPLKIMSSGCMLIACKNGNGLVKVLKSKNISSEVIGVVTENQECFLESGSKRITIQPPEPDELYKIRDL